LRRGELLDQRLATHARLLHTEADLRMGRARGVGHGLDFLAGEVELAHVRVCSLHGPPCVAELPLHGEPLFEERLQLPLEVRQRRLAIGQLPLQLDAPRFQLPGPLARTFEAGTQGGECRSLGFDTDHHLLRRLRLGSVALACGGVCGADGGALAVELTSALFQRAVCGEQGCQAVAATAGVALVA
jgi:hypothetical protein